jgi:uncharacterized protein (TIGR02466 family)
MNSENWFLIPISYDFLFNIDNQKLKEYAYSLKNVCAGNILSNEGGWQSKNLNFNENLEINKLVTEIENRSLEVLKKYDLNKNYKTFVQNIWININKKGDFNIPHVHPGSFFSGVFYVNCNENSGNIVFENPSIGFEYFIANNEIEKINNYNSGRMHHVPQNNKLVIFPGYLNHYVEPNKNNEERISISFNIGTK